ncbi:MAG: hypothetical protein Q7R96_01495 [Nanoarchaeota archaeon]|nr:hypothetical protein [Nanoarchaeota archaeon]
MGLIKRIDERGDVRNSMRELVPPPADQYLRLIEGKGYDVDSIDAVLKCLYLAFKLDPNSPKVAYSLAKISLYSLIMSCCYNLEMRDNKLCAIYWSMPSLISVRRNRLERSVLAIEGHLQKEDGKLIGERTLREHFDCALKMSKNDVLRDKVELLALYYKCISSSCDESGEIKQRSPFVASKESLFEEIVEQWPEGQDSDAAMRCLVIAKGYLYRGFCSEFHYERMYKGRWLENKYCAERFLQRALMLNKELVEAVTLSTVLKNADILEEYEDFTVDVPVHVLIPPPVDNDNIAKLKEEREYGAPYKHKRHLLVQKLRDKFLQVVPYFLPGEIYG